MQTEPKEQSPLAVIAAVQLPGVSDVEFDASVTELRQLAKTLGFRIVRTFTQKRPRFDATAYLGEGKRHEMRRFIGNNADVDESAVDAEPEVDVPETADDPAAGADAPALIEAVFVDHEISPSQARNLETEVGCAVSDRTMVILEIFHRNARSRAARAQVEIARLAYMAPRLRELAKIAGPQGRQRSGTGGRGAGESHTELDRRKLRDQISDLKKEIAGMDAERQTQRARRRERDELATVALVGYTNAGKSTLMRALTASEVVVADKLFATLDTTVRALQPASTPRILVSDTVGFIKNLPHGLVASFRSTLEETLEASLLLHVVDASDAGWERQVEVTDAVLDEIGATEVPRIRIFNKIDHVGDSAAQAEREAALRVRYPECIVMSAHRAEDVVRLHAVIVGFFREQLIEAELFLPWSAQQLRGEIFARCEMLEERADGDGAFFRVRGDEATLNSLREHIAAGQ